MKLTTVYTIDPRAMSCVRSGIESPRLNIENDRPEGRPLVAESSSIPAVAGRPGSLHIGGRPRRADTHPESQDAVRPRAGSVLAPPGSVWRANTLTRSLPVYSEIRRGRRSSEA